MTLTQVTHRPLCDHSHCLPVTFLQGSGNTHPPPNPRPKPISLPSGLSSAGYFPVCNHAEYKISLRLTTLPWALSVLQP